MKLLELTKRLYRLTGKLNLYLFLCCQKNKPDVIRLKKEIKCIKQLISDIEVKIDSI